MELRELISALPQAAASPYALVAYVFLIASSTVLTWRVKRNKNLLQNLEKIPEEQRAEVLIKEMGSVQPSGISEEQWIKHKIHQYYLMAFLALIVCSTVVVVVAYTDSNRTSKARWDSPATLNELKNGLDREYVKSILGIAPISEDISEKLKIKESIIYDRYSNQDIELQLIYRKGKLTAYTVRKISSRIPGKKIWTGENEWTLGKSSFAEAGDQPMHTEENYMGGKSICRMEKHYYGNPGGFNNFTFSFNTELESNEESNERTGRSLIPDTVLVDQGVCEESLDPEASEEINDDKKECFEMMQWMACTYAEDFER